MQSFSLFSFIFLLFSPLFLIAAPITGHSEPKISINNRILARVNGKPLTTYDLVKKMDLAFYKQYPQYASSNMARFQFYQQGWSYVLDDLITEELILADAKESHIEVSAGDLLLLCSDGLSRSFVSDDLRNEEPIDAMADRLLRNALERDGRDNISFVLVKA